MRFNNGPFMGVSMRQRQQGVTFVGLLVILALVGVLVYAGIRLFPVYLTYMKISRTMQSVAIEFKGSTDEGGIRRALERHWSIEDIYDVDVKDIEIKKEDGVVTMHLAYDDKVPYLGNISLVASFEKTVKVE